MNLKRGHIKCPYCSITPISIAKDEVVDIRFDGKQLKMDIKFLPDMWQRIG